MIRAVREQLGCGLLVTGVDRGQQAGVDAANPKAGISERVERSHISPLRKHRAVARGHVSDECCHLPGKVELVGDLGVALLQLIEVLLKLLVAKQRVLVVGRVVDDPAPQLRRGGTYSQSQYEKANQNLSLHRVFSLSCLQRAEGILWLE